MRTIKRILQTFFVVGMTLLSYTAFSQTYQVVWADEFDGTGTGINGISADWGYDLGGNQPNHELETYTTSNHFIQNGMLHIQARKESNGTLTSTRIKTQDKKTWTYGKFECRAALPSFTGSWPSFWSLGNDISSVGWPSCGEIDVFEQLNTSGTIYGTCHYLQNGGDTQQQGYANNTSIGAFHTYAVIWEPNKITWYFDGAAYFTANTSGISAFTKPFFVLLNFALGGDFPNYASGNKGLDYSALPADYVIDYVRVSQLSNATIAVTGVSVSPTTLTVNTGSTGQLTATVAPTNATNKNVTWSSNNTNVATVSSTGLVTGISAGTATITVTTQDGNKTATCAVTVNQPLPDLALNKPTTTSSTESATYPGANAVDGNGTTRWSSAFADPQWISVDLQATYSISKVSLSWEAASAKAYQIQVSNDNVNWTSIYTTTTSVGGNQTLNVTGTGRYVRMYGTVRNTPYGYSLYSFVVNGTSCTAASQPGAITGNTSVASGSSQTYSVGAVSSATSYTWTLPGGWTGTSTTNSITTTVGTTGGTITVKANNGCGASAASSLAVSVTVGSTTNLALNKTTTVSSIEAANYPGSAAVDGNGTTRWSSAFADPQWIYVDLGASYNVNRVKVTWETASAKNYTIDISNDHITWTAIKTVTNNTTLVNDNTGLAGTGRYIRVYGSARTTPYGYSIFELEVYGASAGARSAFVEQSTTSEINEVGVYPVPMKDQLTIRIPKNKYNQAQIVDVVTGRIGVEKKIQKDETEVHLNVDHMLNGIYVLILKNNNGTSVIKKIIK